MMMMMLHFEIVRHDCWWKMLLRHGRVVPGEIDDSDRRISSLYKGQLQPGRKSLKRHQVGLDSLPDVLP